MDLCSLACRSGSWYGDVFRDVTRYLLRSELDSCTEVGCTAALLPTHQSVTADRSLVPQVFVSKIMCTCSILVDVHEKACAVGVSRVIVAVLKWCVQPLYAVDSTQGHQS